MLVVACLQLPWTQIWLAAQSKVVRQPDGSLLQPATRAASDKQAIRPERETRDMQNISRKCSAILADFD
jgi:hypothetical protein